MNRTLLEELKGYFSKIENPNEQEKHLQLQLEGEIPFFKITSVSRDDLEEAGFDASKVSDAEMCVLAEELADDYCEQLFWRILPVLAEDYLQIPKNKNFTCPFCNANFVDHDVSRNTYCCTQCGTQWYNHFVLVEFPEDASPFEWFLQFF